MHTIHPDRQKRALQTRRRFKNSPNLPVYGRNTVQRRDIILDIQVGLLVNTGQGLDTIKMGLSLHSFSDRLENLVF